jgi:ABC-type bacteriocin/lantibiotic exporter with double-glycine peptidase domain
MLNFKNITMTITLCIILTASSLSGYAHTTNSVRYIDDPNIEPLASQCGFEAIYLVLRAYGRNTTLSGLISDFIGNEKVEKEGLSIGEICDLLEKKGLRCKSYSIQKDEFEKIDIGKHFLICLVKIQGINHFEVILKKENERFLLSAHGKANPVWVDKEEMWEIMEGPVIVVSEKNIISMEVALVSIGCVVILVTISREKFLKNALRKSL